MDHFHLHRADSWWSFNKCSSCSSSHCEYETSYRLVSKVCTTQKSDNELGIFEFKFVTLKVHKAVGQTIIDLQLRYKGDRELPFSNDHFYS